VPTTPEDTSLEIAGFPNLVSCHSPPLNPVSLVVLHGIPVNVTPTTPVISD